MSLLQFAGEMLGMFWRIITFQVTWNEFLAVLAVVFVFGLIGWCLYGIGKIVMFLRD